MTNIFELEANFGVQLKDKEVEIKKLQKRISFAESALCATLKIAAIASPGIDLLDCIDYADAGITKEALQAWWANHQEREHRHRKEQAAKEAANRIAAKEKADRIRLAREAAAKLSPEQLAALLLVAGFKTPNGAK
jgi:hypothetical protein